MIETLFVCPGIARHWLFHKPAPEPCSAPHFFRLADASLHRRHIEATGAPSGYVRDLARFWLCINPASRMGISCLIRRAQRKVPVAAWANPAARRCERHALHQSLAKRSQRLRRQQTRDPAFLDSFSQRSPKRGVAIVKAEGSHDL